MPSVSLSSEEEEAEAEEEEVEEEETGEVPKMAAISSEALATLGRFVDFFIVVLLGSSSWKYPSTLRQVFC